MDHFWTPSLGMLESIVVFQLDIRDPGRLIHMYKSYIPFRDGSPNELNIQH